MIDVEVCLQELVCHRCAGPALLSARVPHRFRRADGVEVGGRRTVLLCPSCERDDPDAQGVLAFFTVHACIDDDNTADASAVIRQWLDTVSARPPQRIEEAHSPDD